MSCWECANVTSPGRGTWNRPALQAACCSFRPGSTLAWPMLTKLFPAAMFLQRTASSMLASWKTNLRPPPPPWWQRRSTKGWWWLRWSSTGEIVRVPCFPNGKELSKAFHTSTGHRNRFIGFRATNKKHAEFNFQNPRGFTRSATCITEFFTPAPPCCQTRSATSLESTGHCHKVVGIDVADLRWAALVSLRVVIPLPYPPDPQCQDHRLIRPVVGHLRTIHLDSTRIAVLVEACQASTQSPN